MVVLAAPLVGLALSELVLRWLLFSPRELAGSLGKRFRDPSLFVPWNNSEDYHKLLVRLDPVGLTIDATPHAELGWVGSWIDPETLRQVDEAKLGKRRPILLFGSSYAACSQARAACFQQLMKKSELGRRFALLNFAVPAYGPDQALLLFERVSARFEGLDPIVVFNVVDDVDPVRATLPLFNFPKPRFVARPGGFELEYPEVLGREEYLARHPIGIRSFVWNYLRYGAELIPGAAEERQAIFLRSKSERAELLEYCFERFSEHAVAAGFEHFVLLFHSARSYRDGKFAPDPEQQRFRRFLEQNELPFVDSDAEVEAHLASTGAGFEELTTADHPNARGTEVLFGALVRGLEAHSSGAR